MARNVSKSLGAKKVGDPYNRNDSLSKKDYTKEAATRNQMGPRKVPSGNDALRARGAALGPAAFKAASKTVGPAMRAAVRMAPGAGAVRGAAAVGAVVGTVIYEKNATSIQDYIDKVKTGGNQYNPNPKAKVKRKYRG